jgi:hypothetical protein
MRAPPLDTMQMNGMRRSAAISRAEATFSPTTLPMLPPMKLKSNTASTQSRPLMRAVPVTTASFRPVSRRARSSRSR